MLKVWNEVKKAVILTNNGAEQHIINAIAKFVFEAVKNEVKTTEKKEVDVKKINQLIEDFWYANKQIKKSSNPKTLRTYSEMKIEKAAELLEIITNCEDSKAYFNAKTGQWSEYILKFASAYIPTLNRFGKLGSYAKFA